MLPVTLSRSYGSAVRNSVQAVADAMQGADAMEPSSWPTATLGCTPRVDARSFESKLRTSQLPVTFCVHRSRGQVTDGTAVRSFESKLRTAVPSVTFEPKLRASQRSVKCALFAPEPSCVRTFGPYLRFKVTDVTHVRNLTNKSYGRQRCP